VPPSGGACEDSADGRRTSRAAFGWWDADAVRNANVRPRPLSGGTVTAVVQRRHQPRRCGMTPSGVSARLTVAVRWITCMGPGPALNQIVRLSMLSARKGGHARRRDECLQLRCKRIEPFEPARSFSCLRSAPQADVDRKVRVSECAHPVWLLPLPERAARLVRQGSAATRSNAPSSDVKVVPGGIPAPSGAGPSSETL